ncbi:MAG: hypothetical protein ACE5HB_11025 [Terriglobia bacterium]
MMTVEQLGETLLAMGFARGQVTTDPASTSYIYRTPRVALAVPARALETCFEPPHRDEAGAPWAVELKLEARWFHASDIYKKNGLPVARATLEQYLSAMARMGVFPRRVEAFYEFEPPGFLDLALSVNMKAEPADLTAEIVRERLQPLIDVLVRAEIFLVFGATLDVLRSEEQQKAEQARIQLPAES